MYIGEIHLKLCGRLVNCHGVFRFIDMQEIRESIQKNNKQFK